MADACLADYESMVFGALEHSRSQDIATEGTISITKAANPALQLNFRS